MYALAIFAEQGNVLAVDASAAVVFLTTLLFVWILNPLLFRPLNQVLDERNRRTVGYHTEAQAMLGESERKLARYEAEIRRGRAETYEMLEQRRKEAVEHRARIMEAAKQDVANEIAQARQQIQQQVAEAQSQLMAESQRIAQRIAASILGRYTEEVTRAS
ncbi:MAG: ATP synthase F0 subunit B [Acidobacteria bacterium]|nr:ATP synthase F0 subunit B [Acidobacteriota bacterium]